MAASKKSIEVSPNQFAILKALEAYMEEGLTRKQIREIAKIPCTQHALGPSYLETLKSFPNCLWAKGYVSAQEVYEGDRPVTVFRITDEGFKVVQSYRTRRYSTHYGKVPPDILNPVVIVYAKTVTYGHDVYKDRDINIIRARLPEEYHHISNEDLKAQIIGQRKMGAYKKEHPLPDWYEAYRTTPEFLAKQDEVLEKWNGECAINATHEGDILAYHRRLTFSMDEKDGGGEYSIIDAEDISHNDLIPLCEKCALRLRVSLVKFPDKEPKKYYE